MFPLIVHTIWSSLWAIRNSGSPPQSRNSRLTCFRCFKLISMGRSSWTSEETGVSFVGGSPDTLSEMMGALEVTVSIHFWSVIWCCSHLTTSCLACHSCQWFSGWCNRYWHSYLVSFSMLLTLKAWFLCPVSGHFHLNCSRPSPCQ